MEPIITWMKPPQPFALANEELHVWRVALDHPPVPLEILATYLSADELARAQRFVFPRDKTHFIAGRGALRALLGRYLRTPPNRITIQKGSREKPYVATETGGPSVHFNLSHSKGLALYAFTLRSQVGIDVEKLRAEFATDQVAAQFFSPINRRNCSAFDRKIASRAFSTAGRARRPM